VRQFTADARLRRSIGNAPNSTERVLLWRRVGFTGQSLSAPAIITRVAEIQRSPAVAFGDDEAFVLWAAGKGTILGATDLTSLGQVVTPSFPIAKGAGAQDSYAIARQGSRAVAAWVGRAPVSHIGLPLVGP
jgi:hypothetical protein